MFAGKKSAQIREILISESAWEEMTCLFAPSLAIEPMSCPPNAFNSGIDLLLLKPKQQHILFFNICGECI
ncbi:hypothetical protein GY436_003375 [Salmonella enterica]|nr:hypothetical protein [Salmonella enterica subsp. enterica serovar Heidelberg]